ncbi:MAG: hypothetical protein A07HB70_02011 [uncultured archaeon A07HB70]|nr:MAG: hypothetical protein A07HB70_02011 [uncultured archaeon A07HB70]
MSDDPLREAICDCIAPGSLDLVTVVDRLNDRWPDRRIRAEVESMVTAGVLERHPSADRVYRVVDESRRDRVTRLRDLRSDAQG